jgi:hypothetical protein
VALILPTISAPLDILVCSSNSVLAVSKCCSLSRALLAHMDAMISVAIVNHPSIICGVSRPIGSKGRYTCRDRKLNISSDTTVLLIYNMGISCIPQPDEEAIDQDDSQIAATGSSGWSACPEVVSQRCRHTARLPLLLRLRLLLRALD